MDQATQLWAWWLSLLRGRLCPGVHATGLGAFCPMGHRHGAVLGGAYPDPELDRPGLESRWRVLEHFAEYGAWDREAVERHTLRLLAQEWPAQWGCYHPVAVDDTKLHRTSKQVWGSCTFHESSARSPESGWRRSGPTTGW